MSEVLIRCDTVSKKFCRDLKKSLWYGLQDSFSDLAGSGTGTPDLRNGEFWANREISFELCRGECLGLVGHNGAGKTTLLKMLNGLIKPDEGSISMKGTVSALIALGAGFNPVLTGRENVYVNGSILGLRKSQIRRALDEIIDFSDLDEFIDTPVRSYSSGMKVRLGFAVATVLINPDILILDEVLAVGDRGFRQKCFTRISQLLSTTAVVFVSHQSEHVARICNRGLVLERGVQEFSGDIQDALDKYFNLSATSTSSLHRSSEPIESFSISCDTTSIEWGEQINVAVECLSRDRIERFQLQIFVRDSKEMIVAEWHSKNHVDFETALKSGENSFRVMLEGLKLAQGEYFLTVNMLDPRAGYFFSSVNECKFSVQGCFQSVSAFQL